MLDHEDIRDLMKAMGPVVRQFVSEQVSAAKAELGETVIASLRAENVSLRERLAALEAAGPARNGKDGIGITHTLIDADGALCLTRSDGELQKLGRVQGRDGLNGIDGKDGATIERVLFEGDCRSLLMTDGRVLELGALAGKDGADGRDGRDGERGIPGSMGEKGEPGLQGPQGERGFPGADGADGKDGLAGIKGEKGDPGERGIPGERGEKGEPGLHGKDGRDGEQGLPGDKGEPGRDGLDGKDGLAGPQGERGLPGELGPQGPQGDRGFPGADGRDGEPGIAGEKGERGEPGEKGLTGERGEKGERGDAGPQGEPGIMGPQGERGEKGEPGERGEPGLQGKDGRDGEQGLRGEKGDPGRDGSDADATEAIEALKKQISAELDAIKEKMLTKDETREIGFRLDDEGDLIARWFGRENNLGRARGKDGKPGADGMGFDDFELDFDGERKFVLRLLRDGRSIERTITVPTTIYRGIWREGGEYEAGDQVTYAGSIWTAKRNTGSKPGDGEDTGWQLAVKKGRDGKSAYDIYRAGGGRLNEKEWLASLRGPEGKPGIQGVPGRDRT